MVSGCCRRFCAQFVLADGEGSSGLDYTWAGTYLFAKRARTLPPDQFEVRPRHAARVLLPGKLR
jgi:hypothetical protein